ncbi:CmNV_011-like protein [Aratus pisonii nudivirus]|nr:CmNV_011-like protein [Aratus pisonii nudivirus]
MFPSTKRPYPDKEEDIDSKICRMVTESCSQSNVSEQNAVVNELFKSFKDNSNTTTSVMSDADSYLSQEDFLKGRLNIVNSGPEIVEIKANMIHFNEYLSKTLKDKLLYELFQKNDNEKYNILYGLLYTYFVETTTNSDDDSVLMLIMIVLNSIIIYKDKFIHSNFEERINSIIKSHTERVNFNKMTNNVLAYLNKFISGNNNDDNNDSANNTSPVVNDEQFKECSDMLEITEHVLSMCNKIIKLGTSKSVQFKLLSKIKPDYNNKNLKISNIKAGLRVQLSKSIMLKCNVKTINDGISLINICEEESEFIIDKLKTALKFKSDIRFFSNITVGELKNMRVLKMYDITSKPEKFNKNNISKESYITTDALNVIYNESANSLGLSVKCWPMKHVINNVYTDTPNEIHILDFDYDKKDFNFMNE